MENLLLKLRKAYPDHYGEIKKAYAFAAEAHKGQKRSSGEDYIIHPCAVVEILADFHGQATAVRYKNQLAMTFHPEITDSKVIHEYFLKKVVNVTSTI